MTQPLVPGQSFRNSILGGNGTLVRPQMQSPDYVAGVSGWIIRRDGTVEFNNGIFRGTIVNGGLFIYNGAPAFGNLIMAISPTGGTDAFGNHYELGLSFPPNDGTHNIAELTQLGGTLTLLGPGDGTGAGVTQLNLYGNGAITPGRIRIYAGAGAGSAEPPIELFADNSGEIYINGLLKVAAGVPGLYYAETVEPAAQVITSGVAGVLANLTAVNLSSDYGSAYDLAGGVWTCPVSSWFDLSGAIRWASFVAGSRVVLRVRINGSGVPDLEQDQTSTNGSVVTAGSLELVAGDTLVWEVVQITGANRTVSPAHSQLTIARRL
jgi:hypothetical protein